MIRDFMFVTLSVVLLWVGAGISLSGIDKLSKSTKISSFIISFFALGFLTSSSEISVAFFSLLDNTPGVSVGNLIGGSAVVILLIIPLLAIFNKGIKYDEKTEPINFAVAYLVVSLPAFLVLDGSLNYIDALLMIISYVFMIITISNKVSIINKIEQSLNHRQVNILQEFAKIVLGVILIFISSKIIVDNAVLYSAIFGIPPFLIGLILLSIGTNLPEITILVRSTILKKKSVALGDYIGSAAVNTLTLGFLTIFNKEPIILSGGVKVNLLLLPIGALSFLFFVKNKKLDVREGYALIGLYVLFIATELLF